MELVPHYVNHEQALACLGPVVIRVIWTARTEPDDIDRVAQLLDRVLEHAPAAGLWVVVHHDSPVPDGATRRYGGRVMKRYDKHVCIVYSLLGLGFWASAASAAMSAISKLSGVYSPRTQSLEAGAQHLCSEFIGLNPGPLLAAHDTLLASIAAYGEVA